MKIIKQIIIAISIFGFLYPCDCAPLPSPEDAYNMADVVFSGQVTTIVDDWNNLLKEVSIDVYDVWKGTIQNDIQVIIFTGIDDGICGYDFEVNEEYLIYGNYSGDFVWTNICTRTNLLENSEEDLDYLNGLNNGDLNDDGNVDVLDVIILVNHILSPTTMELDGADINNDGEVNILDVIQLVNIILNVNGSTVTDIDGNIYETILIGDQLWMAENLKVTHFQNSDEIPYIYNDPQYGAYINYSNNADNVAVYGRLYNWFAVNDERGLCPDNWHVPSDDEFKSLEMYLGMSESEANGEGLRGTDEGGKLKEEGNEHWNSPNTGATNETGFTALPGGNRRYETYTNQEIFCCLNRYGFFWSSSEVYTVNAWYRVFSFDYSESNRYHLSKTNAFSIRCVED